MIRRPSRCRLRVAVGAIVAVCTSFAVVVGPSARASSVREPSHSQVAGELTVSAAASLTDAFTRISRVFEKRHRKTTIHLNFGPSSTLATQILQGAPADVFASADTANMTRLVTAGAVTVTPDVFAHNRLVIVVKPGNPERVRSLGDLARLGVVALCASTVPCGQYAAEALARAQVDIPEQKISRGADVKATLAAVSFGDADAGIVYETDARSAGRSVSTVRIPDAFNVEATYVIAPVSATENRALAKAFVGFVLSARGQSVLARYGFVGV